jgi:uncharacterized membrane protein (UPF0127 family)
MVRAPLRDAWLVSDARVLASASVTQTRAARRRGLVGAREVPVPLVIEPCRWVHSLGLRCTLDVAYLAADGTVLKVQRLAPWRVALPVPRARRVVEAAAGSFARWDLRPGMRVEVRG